MLQGTWLQKPPQYHFHWILLAEQVAKASLDSRGRKLDSSSFKVNNELDDKEG